MEQLQNCDSPGYDICQIPNKTPEELYKLCQFIPLAEGFNSNGFIKYYSPKLKNEPGCTFYRLKRQTPQLSLDELPQVWCKTTRDDVIEFLNERFSSVRILTPKEEVLTELVASGRDVIIVVSENVELAENASAKMSHALASVQAEDWDIISFAGEGPLTDVLPKVIPFPSDPNMCYAITRLCAMKLQNKQPITIKTCIPHLATADIEESVFMANNDNYKFFLQNLTYNINNSDIATFKTWECFGKKGLWIYVPDDPLANNNYDKNLQMALRRFTLQDLRDPMPDSATKDNGSSAIIIRHAGNFAEANIDLSKYDHIFEVGAGFGALANVILSSGYSGTYTIYDFELMEKVFRQYITKPVNFVHKVQDILCRPRTLLISTWGISEMPSDLAVSIVSKCKPAGVYIIAQNMYEQRNNVDFFTSLLKITPTIYDERSSKFWKY